MPTLLGVALALSLLIWLLRRGERADIPPQEIGDPEVDYPELEQAEREVRDLDLNARPDEGFVGDDWGPGTGKGRPPERL